MQVFHLISFCYSDSVKFTISRDFFFRSKKKILNSWTKTKRKMIFYFFIRFLSVNEPEGRAARAAYELTSLVKVLFSWGVRHRHFVNNFLRKFAVPFSRQENWPLSDSFELQFSFWNSLLMYHSISANKLELKTVYKKQRFHHLKKYGQKKTLEIFFFIFQAQDLEQCKQPSNYLRELKGVIRRLQLTLTPWWWS